MGNSCVIVSPFTPPRVQMLMYRKARVMREFCIWTWKCWGLLTILGSYGSEFHSLGPGDEKALSSAHTWGRQFHCFWAQSCPKRHWGSGGWGDLSGSRVQSMKSFANKVWDPKLDLLLGRKPLEWGKSLWCVFSAAHVKLPHSSPMAAFLRLMPRYIVLQ